ncbi:MAG: hypothetical protein ACK4PR_07425, partial [Gammaproteobacteria bacterium]
YLQVRGFLAYQNDQTLINKIDQLITLAKQLFQDKKNINNIKNQIHRSLNLEQTKTLIEQQKKLIKHAQETAKKLKTNLTSINTTLDVIKTDKTAILNILQSYYQRAQVCNKRFEDYCKTRQELFHERKEQVRKNETSIWEQSSQRINTLFPELTRDEKQTMIRDNFTQEINRQTTERVAELQPYLLVNESKVSLIMQNNIRIDQLYNKALNSNEITAGELYEQYFLPIQTHLLRMELDTLYIIKQNSREKIQLLDKNATHLINTLDNLQKNYSHLINAQHPLLNHEIKQIRTIVSTFAAQVEQIKKINDQIQA